MSQSFSLADENEHSDTISLKVRERNVAKAELESLFTAVIDCIEASPIMQNTVSVAAPTFARAVPTLSSTPGKEASHDDADAAPSAVSFKVGDSERPRSTGTMASGAESIKMPLEFGRPRST